MRTAEIAQIRNVDSRFRDSKIYVSDGPSPNVNLGISKSRIYIADLCNLRCSHFENINYFFALGCALSYSFLRCCRLTCVYFCVVERLAWPSSS